MLLLATLSISLLYAAKIQRLLPIPKMSPYDSYVLNDMTRTLDRATQYTKHRRSVRLALELAFCAHYGQLRASGEHFVTHPFEVSAMLANMQMDSYTIIAALLHDCLEDTNMDADDLRRTFGDNVALLVQGVTKVSKLKPMSFKTKDEKYAENMRSLFVAMSHDWRVIIIKLADRLHNMRTLDHLPIHKQITIASETSDVFVPIAHRLGLRHVKCELGDLSLKYLDPQSYYRIKKYVHEKVRHSSSRIDFLVSELHDLLASYDINITYRTKCLHSIHKKMMKWNTSIRRVKDIFAIRLVVTSDDPSICYSIMMSIRSKYRVLSSTFKDYISHPKRNGYQSLQFIVQDYDEHSQCDRFIEIQIRTHHMHMIAEFGSAAHWMYHGEMPSDPWQRAVQQLDHRKQSTVQFVELVKRELDDNVYFFTESGLKRMQRGISAIQATSAVNKPLWMYDIHVNNKIVQDEYILQNGDAVRLRPKKKQLRGMEKKICDVCHPIPGDTLFEIGDVIHRESCGVTESCMLQGNDALSVDVDLIEDLISLSDDDRAFEVSITIVADDRRGILLELVQSVTNHVHNIIDVHTTNERDISTFHFRIQVHDADDIDNIYADVDKIPGILKIIRQ